MAAPIEFILSFLIVTSSQHIETVSADISRKKEDYILVLQNLIL